MTAAICLVLHLIRHRAIACKKIKKLPTVNDGPFAKCLFVKKPDFAVFTLHFNPYLIDVNKLVEVKD
jgi:hypothetical protein